LSTGVKAKQTGKDHTWFVCTMCGPAVRCGTCGNNCCNGGYGSWPLNSKKLCPDCPRAYKVQDKQPRPPKLMKVFKSLKFKTPTDRIFGRWIGK
jgi:hypothetical protein